ncbi:uncharacterized protein BO72DRAFT_443720 [Aspergillus fijiensis CBS 313.89]|uniref:non-specific serine/threonine protein kinase n=1 Tax=Aspergillus fijiensis CBS 313.89 TaxID=1448319 RepID=A0A8G1W3B0_9EURO|nr:uncharacterized protein BO72DRAFT_443720 [Aspergillus fijiensis CBS 313.89]RAK82277.1 hypothetical protein BO72DRAFT_443720 [Aspergillus fijiensis CBS 313.89]
MSSSDSDSNDTESLASSLQPTVVAYPDEEVLCLDLEENDYLYRIRKGNRIVYARIFDGDVIPPDYRTDSYRILLHLRKVPRWEEEWTTITVRRGAHGLESTLDEFKPHGLNLAKLDVSTAKFYNISDLSTVFRIGARVFRVKGDGEIWILKIAQFKHEIRYLQQEVAIYSELSESGFPLAPRFIGYAYEDTRERTIGFLMEDIPGYPPDIRNLEECTRTIRLLHAFGFIHGDTNRYNFLITDKGAHVIDFESTVALADVDSEAASREVDVLEVNLRDESGRGRKHG